MNIFAGHIHASKRWLLVSVALVLGACANLPDWVPQPGGGTKAGAPERAPSGRSGEKGSNVDLSKTRRGSASGGSRGSRASVRGGAISMKGRCKQKEQDGYAEDATVNVAGGKVTALSWKISVPKRGTCRFNASQFKQTKTSPSVELLARNGSGCKLLMWSDARRITLAHAGCAKFCTPGVYDKAWPVMFNPKNGRCADIRR